MTFKLRDYQREAIDETMAYWGNGGGNPLIVMPTGCHAAGTRVIMFDGSTKAIEDVVPGDVLVGPDGGRRNVMSLARGREEMFRITPKKGKPFVVNAGHIMALKTTNEGKHWDCCTKGGELNFVTVRDYIGKSKSWKHLRKLWKSPAIDFEFREAPDFDPWTLGCFIGDGSILSVPQLTTPDHEIDSEVSAYCLGNFEVRRGFYQKSDGNKSWTISFSSPIGQKNPITEKMRELGVWGCRAGDKFIPDMYKLGSQTTRMEILAGLIDTDGHLMMTGGFEYCSKSIRLINDITFVARSLGFYVGEPCKKVVRGEVYYRIGIYGELDTIPTRVPHKISPPRSQKKDPLKCGFSVESVGEGDYFGFELDGDHLYMTDDFFVHHNTGKAPTLCTLIKELVLEYQGMRVVNLTHVKELVGQNAQTLRRMWDWAPMGIYSAGLGRRDLHNQILFAGIQSIAKKVRNIGAIDLTIVDECDLISPNDNTLYQRFLAEAREINPSMRLLGLTATPYRLGSGYIHEGENAMFDDIAYEYKMTRAFDEGWLKPLTTKDYDDVRAVDLDMSGVGKSGGDYIQKQLQAATDKDHLNRAIAESIVRRGIAENRKSWLVFATGEEHARHLAEHISSLGVKCGVITGNSGDRDRLIAQFKAGEIRCLVNINVLTVGFDHPGIDLIAFARPTKSLRLYVQMLGRGTRPVWPIGFDPNIATADERKAAMKASEAPNCLVLDYAKNINEFGPVDLAEPKRPGKKGGGDAPVKTCPNIQCCSVVHASVMVCPDCGFVWERMLSDKITQKPAMQPVMSKAEPVWLDVKRRSFYRHEKFGSAPSVRVEYLCGLTVHKEWVSIEHAQDGVRAMAKKWWRQNGGQSPEPESVDEALERAHELQPIAAIRIEPSGKYFKITGRRMGEGAEDHVEAVPSLPDGMKRGTYEYDRWLEEDVPF